MFKNKLTLTRAGIGLLSEPWWFIVWTETYTATWILPWIMDSKEGPFEMSWTALFNAVFYSRI
jgi:hypothetical protein